MAREGRPTIRAVPLESQRADVTAPTGRRAWAWGPKAAPPPPRSAANGRAASRTAIVLDSREFLHGLPGWKAPRSRRGHSGDRVTIEGKCNNKTRNIPFRANFPNPDGLLRHGQTGNVLIHRTVKDAIVIPQRVTFEVLDKRYVYVVGEDEVAHRREIAVQHELEDVFVVENGLSMTDRIVLEGPRQVRDGEKLEYKFRKPEEALANQKNHAE